MGIYSSGSQRWTVTVPVGRDPLTGKPVQHYKAIRGTKKDAQAFWDWLTELVAAGQGVSATVSQSELRDLQKLRAKADQFQEKLEASIQAGAHVEPGPLQLKPT